MVRLKQMRWVLAGLLSLALLLAAVPALADSMNIAYRGSSSVTVWIDGNRKNAITAEFYTPSTYQDATWFGYCVDPLQTFKNPIDPGNPDSWTGPEISPAVTSFNWRESAWLMEQYAPGMDWLNDPGSVNYGSSAVKFAIQAVQLAIWKVTLDSSATYSASDITDTSSRFYTGSSAAANLAGSYLVALSEYKSTHGGAINLSGEYKINDQSDRQDLIVGTGGTGAPEPATMLLMASALALGGGVLRRRRKKA
ncbi:MAG: PEP-CTERM sorting domain-containing protein [Proteobacteria bacterium]|nr:PEP-CTERM sorting domain-containing protein [Pseudomonadota bacterium]MBU1451953.1 PEP-CTERM sorting domain-containing protein [Pseudomonadota bacterium]MBU2467999.1 PEP-CTERM sorting domain-containing protein [Pseudomonadota bacterium]MBU2516456.1 PEP-CTERM sorting domain-containing protein [Pseudomonadota bacterium]